MSEESITTSATSENSFTPKLTYSQFQNSSKIQRKMFKTKQSIFYSQKCSALFIYEFDTWLRDLNVDSKLKGCLFGAVKLTKNADLDKYSYSGYGSGVDLHSLFLTSNFDFGENIIIFDVDNSSSIHANNKEKRYLNSWRKTNSRVCITLGGTVFYMLIV